MDTEFIPKDRFQLYKSKSDIEISPSNSIQPAPSIHSLPQPGLSGAHQLRAQSRTIDELMNQNEDLMARLMVALRRAGDLETQLKMSEEAKALLKSQVDQIQDQILVLKQKDKWVSERFDTREQSFRKLEEDHRLLQTQYAEYYLSSKSKLAEVRKERDLIYSRLHRAKKNQKNLLRIASHYRLLLKKNKTSELEVQSKLADESALRKQLQIQLGQAGERIQSLKNQMDEAAQLYQRTLESQKKQQAQELDQVKAQLENIAELKAKIELEEMKRIELENSNLHLERQFSHFKEKSDLTLSELQEQVKGFRIEAKNKTIALDHVEKEKIELIEENNLLANQRAELMQQVETLQGLWQDQQLQIEKLTQKNHSLQNLNRQMSQQIMQSRKEKTLRIEAAQVQQTSCLKRTENSVTEEEKQPVSQVSRLLLEIQSGFSRSVKADESSPE